MRQTEIKDIKEYYWGSIVSVIEKGSKPDKIITAKVCYLIGAVTLLTITAFMLGFLLGRV